MIEHIGSGLGIANSNNIDSGLGMAKFRIIGFESQSTRPGRTDSTAILFSVFYVSDLGEIFAS